ncbi:protein kinase [bacterium]|nr:protein kinase [bacterium]
MTGKDMPPRADNGDAREKPEQPSVDQPTAEGVTEDPLTMTGRAGGDDLRQASIGPYRLLETLGEGGMGVVYLAEQREPIRRRVALKVIKLGMDTREVIARFESERQALAMMNHPNIACVLGAGTTEAGRPYFVMEHVPGVPITDYCDRHKLTTRQRLELFRPVCLALQHAHQKGIIHRDIKPSNVLVRVQDGKPVPKVIDFGVAKAIDRTLTEKTLFTQQGRLVGTPAYMSPEQAEMTGLNVDTTSDVYSLGVLLYELLAGVQPFEQDELRRAGLLEMHRIIREVDPPRPSTKISGLGATGTDLAHRRRVEVRAWQRQLRGELDWITMRAIEKDRTRRYASASEFAADIMRFLRDEPVAAGPPGSAYRLGKFVRRHRSLVMAVGALVVVLIGGFIGVSASLSRALKAEAVAAREAERARIELDRSRQVIAFTSEMLSGIDPEVARGKDQELLRLILNDAAARMDTELAGQPEVAASLQMIVGRTYESIGEYAEAEPRYEQAVELRRGVLGGEHRETLFAETALAGIYSATGRYEEAERLFDQVLERQRRLLGEEDAETLTTMNDLALLYGSAGRLAEAE